MKYIITEERQPSKDLKFAYFDFGAPFTSAIFKSHFDEATKGVYQSSKMDKEGTFALDSETPYTGEEGYNWKLKHIDEYEFAPITFRQYLAMYPNNEAIEIRIPRNEEGEYDEAWLDKTPQEYVSEVIIGDNFTVIDI